MEATKNLLTGEQLHIRDSEGNVVIENGLFPHLKGGFQNVINVVTSNSVKGRLSKNLINKIHTAIFEYHMSKYEAFSNTPEYVTVNKRKYSKREYFRKRFPVEFAT